MTPSKLFGIALLLFCISGMLIWITSLMDAGSLAFDCGGLILLGLSIGLPILSLLFLWRAKGGRFVMSVLLHLVVLALLVSLPYTVPAMKTLMGKTTVVAFTLLGTVLLFLAILAFRSDVTRIDLATAQEETSGERTRLYLMVSAGCMLLFVAITARQVVPLLVARPTITVDYLPQANEANKPADYDPDRNAAPYYKSLLAQFAPLPEVLKEKWASWPTDLNSEEFKALEEWASRNEPALSVLSQAAQCPYWWYELKSTDGALSNIQTPDRERRRHCTWGILLLAKHQAARGDTSRALRVLADLHTYGMHQAKCALLVEQMIGAAVCKLSYDGVLSVLAHGEVETEVLKSTLDRFTPQVPSIVVPRLFSMEHLYGLDCLQRLFTDDGQGNGRLIPRALHKSKKAIPNPYSRPISYADAVRICLTHPDRQSTLCSSEAFFTLLREVANQTPWDLHVQNTSYEEQLKTPCFGNYCLHDGLAATAQCIRFGWRSRVSGDATVVILAIFAYKAQEGRLPESLQQLVDKGLLLSVPMDPYSGAPLIYKVNGDDFTLYSIGEDFVDGGGVHCEWNDQSGGDHVFWPVPAPQK